MNFIEAVLHKEKHPEDTVYCRSENDGKWVMEIESGIISYIAEEQFIEVPETEVYDVLTEWHTEKSKRLCKTVSERSEST